MLTSLQQTLLTYLRTKGPETTDNLARLHRIPIATVAAELNHLATARPDLVFFTRQPGAHYATWHTATSKPAAQPKEESPVATLHLTQLQERLVAQIMVRNHGNARSDVLGLAVGVGPGEVSASLLTLRAQGYIGSANDGGQYNYWFVTDKMRDYLDKRAEDQRKQEAARKLETAMQVAERRNAAVKECLSAANHKRTEGPVTLPTQVASALAAAMASKNRPRLQHPKFIVWSPSASQPPRVQYSTRPEADYVAKKMAVAFPGQVFIVCELLDARLVVEVPAQQQAIEVTL